MLNRSSAVQCLLATLLLTLFSLNFFSLAFAEEKTSEVNPALWKLEQKKGNVLSTVYLFGSVHFGHKNFYPLPAVVESAYEDSDVLAVEVDISKVDPQSLLKYASLPVDQSLSQVLEPAVYEDLKKYATQQGIPVTAFDRFQPWFVGMQLVQMALLKSEYNAIYGVDMQLIQRQKKPVEEIESIDAQMQMFVTMSHAEQSAFLKQSLSDMVESERYIDLMMNAWREGDLPGMEKHIIEPMKSLPGGNTLYKKVFTDRNMHMTDAVERYLKSGKTIFYVVGVGHYAGKDSILAMLKGRGHKVERLN